MSENPYRLLPAVNDVLRIDAVAELETSHDHDSIVLAIREELDGLRDKIKRGEPLDGEVAVERVAGRVAERLTQALRPKLRHVINATGIVLHTNLGRAPINEEAAQAAARAASGYLNLELDLETGKRSSRQLAVREWICRLTGAESATVVNNNAAATVIVLRSICQGKEVVLSRGQLIEIGGSFRIPDIMSVSGAILREVGTTNITRLSDYDKAITPETGALLQIHSSNYRIAGFTKSVALADLVTLGRQHNIPVIDDVGSGALVDYSRFGFTDEPLARDSITAGVDLVLFSGDKLLGGPQAGIIAGHKKWIDKIEKDPLMRAFRLDKMTLAALETTLRLYLREDRALREVPVLRMLSTPLGTLRERAQNLATKLTEVPGITSAKAHEDVAYVGGGSLPDQQMKTWVVEVATASSITEVAHRLRMGEPAVMARLREDRLVLDVRTIFEEHEPLVIATMRATID